MKKATIVILFVISLTAILSGCVSYNKNDICELQKNLPSAEVYDDMETKKATYLSFLTGTSAGLVSTVVNKPALWWNVANDTLPQGNGELVVVIPGLWAPEASVGLMVSGLNELGFNTFTWGQGWNHTKAHEKEKALHEYVLELILEHDQQVCFVGWSAGGIVALNFTKEHPELVRCVITLNTPYRYTPAPKHLTDHFERLRGVYVHHNIEVMKGIPARIPITAIYGLEDLMVRGGNGTMSSQDLSYSFFRENVGMHNTHHSAGFTIPTLGIMANRARKVEDWSPYCDR